MAHQNLAPKTDMSIKKWLFSASTIVVFLGCNLRGAAGSSPTRNRWRITAAGAVKLGGLLDGLRQHHSRLVREFVAAQEGRLELEFLPAYAPELNPVEYIWGHLKHHELPNFCARNLSDLGTMASVPCVACAVASRSSPPSGVKPNSFSITNIMRTSISRTGPHEISVLPQEQARSCS